MIPPELQRFIENTLPSIREKLAEWGIVDASRIASVKILDEHISNWDRFLRSKGNGSEYVALKISRVRNLFKACRFVMWNDISPIKISDQLSKWRDEKKNFGVQTSNFYIQAARQFCRYMITKVMKSPSASPLIDLTYLNAKTDRRHDRRAYSVEEFRELLGYLTTAPTIWHIPASERALIYQFAVETGLRHGAIGRLEVRSFGWEKGTPAVLVKAGAPNKYKADRWVFLTHALWLLLAKHIAAKKPADKVFSMYPRTHSAKIIKKDLDAARTAWIKKASDGKERISREESQFLRYENDERLFLDFHAFRHTRGVWLFEYNNAKPRQVQELLGVGSIALVDRYTRSMKFTDHSIIERGPDLTIPAKMPAKNGDLNGEIFAHTFAQEGGASRSSTESGEVEERIRQLKEEIEKLQNLTGKSEVLTNNSISRIVSALPGEVAERLNAPVSKTG